MNASECFTRASKSDMLGSWLFWTNTILSLGLIFAKGTKIEPYLTLPICGLVALSLGSSLWSRHWINKGNGAQRIAQLSDAFGIGCEHPARWGYYNNAIQPGLRRLLATTCESSGLTKEILDEMIRGQLIRFAVFIVVFLSYTTYGKADSSIITIIAQTLFSGDLIGTLVNTLRFSLKVQRAHENILTLFRTSANFDDKHTQAIGLSAHVDYECAKEEAGILLDSKIYARRNPEYTKRWERLRSDFNIDTKPIPLTGHLGLSSPPSL